MPVGLQWKSPGVGQGFVFAAVSSLTVWRELLCHSYLADAKWDLRFGGLTTKDRVFSQSLFDSPFYWLAQDDTLYVVKASLILLGTGAMGLVGILRKRMLH
jgi:hypothetical protein